MVTFSSESVKKCVNTNRHLALNEKTQLRVLDMKLKWCEGKGKI